jgi:hypothetical protein
MNALGSSNYEADEKALQELAAAIPKTKEIYATIYLALTNSSYTNSVLSNPGIKGQGYWRDVNKYWDDTWNKRAWYMAYVMGGYLKTQKTTIIPILGNDEKVHSMATYLIDQTAVDAFFKGEGKGLEKYRAPSLNPATNTFTWYDPPTTDLKKPKRHK